VREVRIVGVAGQGGEGVLMEFGKVAVMMGGKSAEREVSLKSGAAVLAALRASGVDAHASIRATSRSKRCTPKASSASSSPCTGAAAKTAALQGALDLLAIPYTGSGVLASALAMDKWRSKLVWQASGLPVPDYVVLDAASDFRRGRGAPRPAAVRQAGQRGIQHRHQQGQAGGRLARGLRAGGPPRPLRDCRDASSPAANTRWASSARPLPVIRIVPATEFYDYEAKYLRDDTEYRIPSGLGEAREAEMRDWRCAPTAALGGRGWGRMDLMLDADGACTAWKRIPRPA
jgi:D-alanine-D-alanine ligase